MKTETQECANLKSPEAVMGEKYWVELSIEEKQERIRQIVGFLIEEVRNQSVRISKLEN